MNKNGRRYIRNILSLPPIYFFLLQKLHKQKRFIKNQIEKELFPYTLRSDGSLGSNDFKKITTYYSLGVPAVLGESLCALRGSGMHPRERLCMTYLGGISGLLDDLFDDPNKEVNHLQRFILNPEDLKPANLHEKLLLHLYQLGLHYSNNPDLIKIQALKVFESQKKSQEQQKQKVTASEIEKITYDKGGNSFLYYRLCLNDKPGSAEANFIYELGGLMQLGNDIFDIWEDHQAGIKTTATVTTDLAYLRKTFSEKFYNCFSLAAGTPYSKSNILKFQKICSLALARVYVCLDQFEKLQESTGNYFSIKKYGRKQLICDMQKPANQLKALKIYLKQDYKRNFQ